MYPELNYAQCLCLLVYWIWNMTYWWNSTNAIKYNIRNSNGYFLIVIRCQWYLWKIYLTYHTETYEKNPFKILMEIMKNCRWTQENGKFIINVNDNIKIQHNQQITVVYPWFINTLLGSRRYCAQRARGAAEWHTGNGGTGGHLSPVPVDSVSELVHVCWGVIAEFSHDLALM